MSYREYGFGVPSFGGTIRVLVFINLAVWIFQIIPGVGDVVTGLFSLDPTVAIHGQIWRFFTYGFLHDAHSPFHILFNMLSLWMFGTSVVDRWGEKKFLLFYLCAILFSGLVSVIYPLMGSHTVIVGASGGILGVLTLYTIFYPDRELLFFGIIPIKAWLMLVVFTMISVGGVLTGGGSVAHLTHLGGIAFAFLWIWLEPKIILFVNRPVKKEPVIHYFEPRKSRIEIKTEKESVDDVLKKISESGMKSLSEDEYRILEKASGKPVPRE